MTRFTPGKIIIYCPPNFTNFWKTDPSSQIKDLFLDTSELAIALNCKTPADYTPVSEGNGAAINDGLRFTQMTVEQKRLGFRFKVRDRRADLRIAFEELMEASINYSCDYAIPIQIDDYCYLRTRNDRSRGYRTRVGFFTESLSGLQGHLVRGFQATCNSPLPIIELQNSDRYEQGFEFKFMEVERGQYY